MSKKEMKQIFPDLGFFPKNRRAQELSTNVIILIILGVVVLVVLILGFTIGWGKISPWISSNNVNSIVTQCGVACSTNSVYDYCSAKKELKSADETLKDVTCYYLSEKQTKYGIAKCPSVTTQCKVTFEPCVPATDKDKTSQIFNTETNVLTSTLCP